MDTAQVEPELPRRVGRRLVGLDIDGTLLVTGQPPTLTVLAAIKAARARGHELVLATGRSLSGALYAAQQLQIADGWLVASNGSVVIKMTNATYEVVALHTVDARAVVELVTVVRPDLLIATEIVGVGYHVSAPFPPFELGGDQVPVASPADLWAEKTPRIAIHGDNAQDLVPSIRSGGMTATRTRPDWVDVTPGGVSKATALEEIRRDLGIPRSRTVAIGDSENDISMLSWAEYSVAMGNAPDSVRFRAKYATKSIEDDGAALILQGLAGSVPDERSTVSWDGTVRAHDPVQS